MPVPDISGLPPFADFNDVTVKINDLVQRLRQLLLTLDTLNIRSLHAKVIEAETITGDKIQANTITAAKMLVDELSAISADLGKITAGEIYGTYIATRENAFPRAEMSAMDNLFKAMQNANSYVSIDALGGNNSPQVLIKSLLANMVLLMLGNTANISVTGGNLNLHTTENMELTGDEIRIFPNNFRGIRVSAFSDIVDDSSGKSLQDILNEKQDKV